MEWPVDLPKGGVDVLAYYGSWPHWPVPGTSERALLERIDRLGLRVAVVQSLAAIYSDADQGNAELAGLVGRHRDKLVGLVTYDPRRPRVPADVMAQARDADMRGLVLAGVYHGYNLGSEPLVEEALDLAGAWGWPVIIPIRLIACWWLPTNPVDAIVDAARRHPRTPVIIAGGTYGEYEHALRATCTTRRGRRVTAKWNAWRRRRIWRSF